MIDANALVYKWISEGLPSDRVSVAVLPEYDERNGTGFRPEEGPWIVAGVAGGGEDDAAPILRVRIQITVFADKDEGLAASTLSGEIRDMIHGKNWIDLGSAGLVLASTEDSDGQVGADPATGWAMVVSFYQMILRASSSNEDQFTTIVDGGSF